MFRVEMYFQVRRACLVEGMSVREASRVFGLHRDTVGKMLANATPQGYTRQRPPRKPKIEPFTGVIDAILESDRRLPRKQRHTVKRIFERLRDEYGFEGQHTIVKDYVREHRRRVGEMFVPLTHGPGHAQCDFGEALVVIAGVEQKVHYFVLDLPHSDGCFVKAYPGETTEAFLDGHVSAFAFLGGSPQSILYDNTKLAVAKILGGGRRKRTRAFTELQSHYLFEDRFGRPSKGNDKGNVEGMVGYARRNFLVPVPRADDFAALNVHLEQKCLGRMDAVLRGHTETIGQRMERDLEALLPLPAAAYEACDLQSSRVSSLSLVRYRTNHPHPANLGQDHFLAIHFHRFRPIVSPKPLLVLASLEPRKAHPPARTLACLHLLPVLAPTLGGLAEVDDGVLGRVLRQLRSPRRDHPLDLVPPGPQRAFHQPLAHVKASPELAQRPVVGEPSIASVLAEQCFLLRRGLQGNAMRLLHNFTTIVPTLVDCRRARNATYLVARLPTPQPSDSIMNYQITTDYSEQLHTPLPEGRVLT